MKKVTLEDVWASFSDMKETCIYCGKKECYGDCEGSKNDTIGLEDPDYVNDRRTFNAIIDGIQSLILAHSCAGIDVTSEQYQEGIETALDAIQNNYGI
jgi:hypothetical protein